MNKLMLTCAMSLMLLSTSAMALTINVEPKKEESTRAVPPPPPPPAPAKPLVTCKFAEPKCDSYDRIHAERYDNDQKMYSRGECYRGEKERKFDFYCSNGEVWMQIEYRRDRADRIECMDPKRNKFFVARSVGECEQVYNNNYRPEPPRKKHQRRNSNRDRHDYYRD